MPNSGVFLIFYHNNTLNLNQKLGQEWNYLDDSLNQKVNIAPNYN